MKKGKEKRRKITLKKTGKRALKMHLLGYKTPNNFAGKNVFVGGKMYIKRGGGMTEMHNIHP